METIGLLRRSREGDGEGASRLEPLVYDELKRRAAALMRRERAGHTLQPTALVHEAWLRLADSDLAEERDRTFFFAIAARLMRRVLVDHARARGARKRGGQGLRVTFDPGQTPGRDEADALEALALAEVIEELRRLDARRADVVELRVFGGLTFQEAAEVLGVTPKAVESDWYLARAWLRVELKKRGWRDGEEPHPGADGGVS
jgi:RNA polymerase sigma factor (TIGR02999 family)